MMCLCQYCTGTVSACNVCYVWNRLFTHSNIKDNKYYCVVANQAAVDSESEQEGTEDLIGMYLFLGTCYPTPWFI